MTPWVKEPMVWCKPLETTSLYQHIPYGLAADTDITWILYRVLCSIGSIVNNGITLWLLCFPCKTKFYNFKQTADSSVFLYITFNTFTVIFERFTLLKFNDRNAKKFWLLTQKQNKVNNILIFYAQPVTYIWFFFDLQKQKRIWIRFEDHINQDEHH